MNAEKLARIQARIKKQKLERLMTASKNEAVISPSGLVTPSLASVEKYDRASKQTKHCKVCGQSDSFDGAMFTVDSSRKTCDDCYGW